MNRPNRPDGTTETEEYIIKLEEYIDNLEVIINLMLRTKDVSDGQVVCVSNQGQGMDGYTELATYRSILESFRLSS